LVYSAAPPQGPDRGEYRGAGDDRGLEEGEERGDRVGDLLAAGDVGGTPAGEVLVVPPAQE
jgi:hypothetical protein